MFRVSRLLTAIVVLAALWFLWPFEREKDVVRIDTPREPAQDGRLFTKPLRERVQTDATGPEKKNAKPQDENTKDLAAADAKGHDGASDANVPDSSLKPKRFYRVVVRDGGSLTAGGTTIALDGIEVEGLAGTCKDGNGQTWPCGRYARAALTRLIRGRAVICRVPPSGGHETLTARCAVGGQDLSQWMVGQGWATPASQSDAALIEAADTARKRKLGIWR